MSGGGGQKADLHLHTWYSDGRHPPAEVVEMAAKAGIFVLAITDHETVAGIGEALEAGRSLGVEVIPGVEFAARMKKVEVHLLGLWIDPGHGRMGEVIALLQEERVERAGRMVERINGLGIGLKMEDVLAVAGKGGLGRPHVAQALVNVGAVASFEQAFARLIGRDGPAYIPRQHLTPERAMEVIHAAGGLAVLAHGLVGGVHREQVKKIAGMGLDGIEVVHPKLGERESEWLRGFARDQGLSLSGGSDWHGRGWSDGEIGQYYIDLDEAWDLFDRARRYRAGARKTNQEVGDV